MLFRVHVRDDAGKRVPLAPWSPLGWFWARKRFLAICGKELTEALSPKSVHEECGSRRVAIQALCIAVICMPIIALPFVGPQLLSVIRSAGFGPSNAFQSVLVGVVIGGASSSVSLLVLNWVSRAAYGDDIARMYARYGFCGSCRYQLASSPDESDEAMTCPECGATWKHVGSTIPQD